MRIVRKQFSDWDDDVKRRLRYATLPNGFLKRFTRAFPDSPTIVIFLGLHVMGWAFALRQTHDDFVFLNLYINKRYRRRGLAMVLIRESFRDFAVVSLAVWNSETNKLFQKANAVYGGRVIKLVWYDHIDRYDAIVRESARSPRP